MSPAERTNAKIRCRMLYSKFKRPDFKDILRQRFKQRIRENRRALLDKVRSSQSSDNVQSTLLDYLTNELENFQKLEYGNGTSCENNSPHETEEKIDLEFELKILEDIQTELLDEQYSWFMKEFCRADEEIAPMIELPSCPVCQRGCLQKAHPQNPITCTVCNLCLSPFMSLEQFIASLQFNLNEHSSCCGCSPKFASLNELHTTSLLIMCDLCSYFRVIS